MKTITSTAIVALMATTLGLGGLSTASFAQEAAQPQQQAQDAGKIGNGHPVWRHDGNTQRPPMRRGEMMMGGMRSGLLGLVCSPNGSERLEIGFVRLSHRINPTAEQAPLFDALKTSALSAQAKFAETCKSAMTPAQAGTPPTIVDQLKSRLAIETARVAALNDVLPKLDTLYGSLTDAQKAAIQPHRPGWHRPQGGHQPGQWNGRPGMHPHNNPPVDPGHAEGPAGAPAQPNDSNFEG
jgi:hypothetical protein